MTDRTGYAHGEFCWVDLAAHDMAAAKEWYGKLFGWEVTDIPAPQGGPPYSMFTSGGKHVAGLGQMSDEMKTKGIPPMWNSYVSVESAEAIEAETKKLGGAVTFATMKVMEAGSMAFFTDPEGASFAVWQPGQHIGSALVNAPVSLTWNELMTRDVGKAKDFYGKLFGWEFAEMPMDQITYTMIKNGGKDNGGVMPMDEKLAGVPANWMVYFAVADTDAVTDATERSGGKVLVPPTEVPPGKFSCLQDAQGATFSVMKLNNPPA